jgi:hypothetical protein
LRFLLRQSSDGDISALGAIASSGVTSNRQFAPPPIGAQTVTTIAPAMPTVGEIARRLCQPVHRIEYVIRSRNIKAAGIAGNSRVFAESDVAYISGELRRIDEERSDQ